MNYLKIIKLTSKFDSSVLSELHIATGQTWIWIIKHESYLSLCYIPTKWVVYKTLQKRYIHAVVFFALGMLAQR